MDLNEQLRRDEGVRYLPYKDSLGILTIGVGHRILPTDTFSTSVPISDETVNALLDADIAGKQAELVAFPWFMDLDECRQGGITNMAFNIGTHGVLGFPTMIHCLTQQDWRGAHDAALDSLWAKQVGERAIRIATQLLTGIWQ